MAKATAVTEAPPKAKRTRRSPDRMSSRERLIRAGEELDKAEALLADIPNAGRFTDELCATLAELRTKREVLEASQKNAIAEFRQALGIPIEDPDSVAALLLGIRTELGL